MKSLNEHDAERQRWHDEMEKLNKPHPNGIACPKCGKELWDSNPSHVLASNPPQKNIHCPACGYSGFALL